MLQSDIFMCDKFMQIRQNGPLDKFMRSSVLCIIKYGVIKIMMYKKFYLCDQRLTHIIHMNKSHA